MARLRYTLRYSETEDDWHDSAPQPMFRQVPVTDRSAVPCRSGPSTNILYKCETAKSSDSIQWAENWDPIQEWDQTLYHSSYVVYQTSGGLIGDLVQLVSQEASAGPPRSVRKRFDRLVEEWTQDVMFASSSHDIVLHRAYQQVIGLGRQVIPLIYEEMVAGELHWSWALYAITGVNPAAETDSPRDATDAWMRWIEEDQPASHSSVVP